MITRLLTRIASRILSNQRKDPKEVYRAKASEMCAAMGREIPEALLP